MPRAARTARPAGGRNAGKLDVNFVQQHRKIAEDFVQENISLGVIPKNFSGFITPRYGAFVFIWQFEKGKLIGSCTVKVANCDMLASRIQNAKSGPNFLLEVENGIGVGMESDSEDGGLNSAGTS